MSKKSKLKSKAKNAQAKRARKAANQARFQELARLGQNTKSKRALSSKLKKRKINVFGHGAHNCGNFGCKRCNPMLIYRIAA